MTTDEFHLHELLDRAHCINVMFDELVRDHPAAGFIRDYVDDAGAALGRLYQAAGRLRLPESDREPS